MSCETLIKAIDAYIQKADNTMEQELAESGYVNPEETVGILTELEEQIVDTLKENMDTILENLIDADDLQQFVDEIWPGVKKKDKLDKKLQKIFQVEIANALPKLISQYAKQIDPEMIVTDLTLRTTAWINTWSEQLGQIMQLNSHEQIENLLTVGLEEGQSIAEFTQSLMDSGIRDDYYKARRTAITEVLTAHSVAQEEVIIQSPVIEEKEWVHTGSHKVEPRLNHQDMNGKIVPKEEAFVLKGAEGEEYYPLYPRDPVLPAGERINCHCIHRGIVREDILGLPLEERQRLQEEARAADNSKWEKELDAQNKAKAGIEI